MWASQNVAPGCISTWIPDVHLALPIVSWLSSPARVAVRWTICCAGLPATMAQKNSDASRACAERHGEDGDLTRRELHSQPLRLPYFHPPAPILSLPLSKIKGIEKLTTWKREEMIKSIWKIIYVLISELCMVTRRQKAFFFINILKY